MTHGFIGPHSIFVCKTGDWKLGSLELACNLNTPEDRVYYKSKMNMLNDKYMSPERRQFSKSSDYDKQVTDESIFSKQGAADMYAVGVVLQNVLDQMNLTPPGTVGKCLNKMVAADYKKRPSAKQALSYITDQMDILTQLNELAIKPPNESLEILSKLSEHLKDIPVSACHYKVLPNVTKVLQMAANDFRNRDSRESCRQVGR
jgi:serine/threonine protein kinase